MIEPVGYLELRSLQKAYDSSLAIGPIDLSIRKGELLTLLGPSGCGKSTTLHMIAGLTSPTSGSVILGGVEITNVPPGRRDMGVVFQSYALFPHKTIYQNVEFGLRMRRVPADQMQRRVLEMLEIVGLQDMGSRYPSQLSGGQRQRVALARALVIKPKLLLLDEPLSNLDATLRRRMRLEIRSIQQALGTTTIMVTHDQEEAFEISDRIALMSVGKLQQCGRPEELYASPSNRFVAEFVGDANILPCRVSTDTHGRRNARTQDGLHFVQGNCEWTAIADRPAIVLIRFEDVLLAGPDDTVANHAGAYPAKVIDQVFSGDRITTTVELTGGTRIRSLTLPSLLSPMIRPGNSAQVVFSNVRVMEDV